MKHALLTPLVVALMLAGCSAADVPDNDADPTRSVTFSWSYEEADSLNPDGMPETDIYLEAVYGDGARERVMIDTVPSSCNALPDADSDSLPGSTTVQCYGAGLGYRYKVTRGEDAYLVQRQEFEEATPEYEPVPQNYEVIAELAL